MASEKLEAARQSGDLAKVIAVRREEAGAGTTTGTPVREQLDIVDGSIRLAAHLTGLGKTGAERRQAIGSVKIGTTVTATGAAKTKPTHVQQLEKAVAWAKTLTESQRNTYIVGEKFEALPDYTQGLVADAFAAVDDDELVLEDAVGESFDPATYDFNAELVEPDSLADDEFEVQEGEDVRSFDIDDADPWQGDVV